MTVPASPSSSSTKGGLASDRVTPTGAPLSAVGRWLRWIALGCVLLLSGRAAVAVAVAAEELIGPTVEEWSEALGASEEERIFAALERRDEAAGLSAGYHRELYLALQAAVPRDGRVFFLQESTDPGGNVSHRLHVLLYPRLLRRAPPTRPIEGKLDDRTFVVTFDGNEPRGLAVVASPVEESADWVLWQCRGGA